MHKTMLKYAVLLLVISGLLVTVSCTKKEVQSQPSMSEQQAAMQAAAEQQAKQKAEMERQQRLAEQQKLQEQTLEAQQAAEQAKMAAKTHFLNDDVHFDFDSDTLSMNAQDLLKDKAQWLMANPNAHVQIQGNCDERGSNAYNLALGERRAQAAKNFLVTLGIAADRMTTVSFGEEKPLDPAHNEAAWAKNRRDHFVLQ